MNKQDNGSQLIGCLVMLVIVITIIVNVFHGAYVRYTEGKHAPFLILIGLVVIFGTVILTYTLKNEALGKKIRLVPKVIVYVVSGVFMTTFIGYFIFSILRLPFTDLDASIDMGVLILKSDFVKVVIGVLEVIVIIYAIKSFKRLFTKKHGDNL